MKRILYPAKLSFRIEGEIEFSDKQKLKEFITTKQALEKCQKKFYDLNHCNIYWTRLLKQRK